MHKKLLIELVAQLKKKSKLRWQAIYESLGLSRASFQARYCRFEERKTEYESTEVLILIKLLGCEPFEALLLWGWCGLPLSELYLLSNSFKDHKQFTHQDFMVAWLIYLQFSPIDKTWFDKKSKLRSNVKSQLSRYLLPPTKDFQNLTRVILNHHSQSLVTDKTNLNNNVQNTIDSSSRKQNLLQLEQNIHYGHRIEEQIQELEVVIHKLPLSKSENDQVQLIRSIISIKQGKSSSAKILLAKSFAVSRKNREWRVRLKINQGAALFTNGEFDAARECFLKQYEWVQRKRIALMESYLMNALACVAIEQDKILEARYYFLKAIEATNRIEDAAKYTERLLFILLNRAAAAYYYEDFQEAELWIREAEQYLDQQGVVKYFELKTDCLWTKAQILTGQNQPFEALRELEIAEKLSEHHNLSDKAVNIKIEIARVYFVLNECQKALHQLDDILQELANDPDFETPYSLGKLLYHYLAFSAYQSSGKIPDQLINNIKGHLGQNRLKFNEELVENWIPYLYRRFNRGGFTSLIGEARTVQLHEQVVAALKCILFSGGM